MSRTLFAALVISTAAIVAAGAALAVSVNTAPIDGPGYDRACHLGANPWTPVSTDNLTAAYTAALTVAQRYAIQCDVDTYFRPTLAASSGAAATDGWIPAGAWYEHIVLSGAQYVSLLNKGSDSDCRYALCQ